MDTVVVGVDGGGTRTRCVVVDTDGRVLGRAEAGGANPNSSPDPVGALAEALRGAVAQATAAEPGVADRVAAGVFGLAGAGGAGHADALARATAAWRAAGLAGAPEVVGDLVVNFAAGTPESEGLVLVAGTGAIAGRIADGAVVRRCDGYGWLVGDRGSGTWLGRMAVTAVLDALDGRGPTTALTRTVPAALLDELAHTAHEPGSAEAHALAQRLVRAVYGSPPAALAALSPVVDAAARAGDETARTIVAEAADHLVASVRALAPSPGEALVFAGGILTGPTLLAELVTAGFTAAEPAYAVSLAGPGELGAAMVALRRTGHASALARIHADLLPWSARS
ncbi:BadF/BadG/BcrA/BcrD ATPase family protein [Catellatospora sp. KI3]|uniref:N-acetylglucosamine kinase n=1 Tax=Catellatospora sp. KI3 TaxID=3041620 RepID=UPI0024828169|nr:BadF/BadG/BcrA/BcrD ATPase family protein [Catellatospora sp. KI3]MDI1463128.1 BadF/BadG/BcrA/BcrD ATPase family protein [Catellatospora sp. KI3]